MNFRPSTETDKPGIHEVRKASWKKAYSNILPHRIIAEATADVILKEKAGVRAFGTLVVEIEASRFGYVAEIENRIVAFVSGGLQRVPVPEADFEIWAIYVHPDYQGQGIGRHLFKIFLEADGEKNYRKGILWVLKENHPSRLFYEKMGGKLLLQEKMFTWDGQEIAPEVAYLWEVKQIF